MYHFIGIKGTGMSALAIILKQLGYEVTGSDVDKRFFTDVGLEAEGIWATVYDEDNIDRGMIIIKGASIKDDNVELVKAKELGLEIYQYNEMVGKLTQEFKTICVAGCHGKTTTTAMMACVLKELIGLNYLIGDGTGWASSENKYLALESCEYRRHFLAYQPYYAVITNIDLDHVDYFKDIDDVISAYVSYANKASKMVVMCGDDKYVDKLVVDKPIIYYGVSSSNDIWAYNISYLEKGIKFEVKAKGEYYGSFELPIYGEHQLLDALAVITVCYLEGIDSKSVDEKFQNFKGAKRRFSETIIGNKVIIDDYAHHPNEVKALLLAVKQKYKGKKVVAIFQPHTFSRTREICADLVAVLKEVAEAYILDIHPAREKQEDYPGVTSSMIIDKLDNGYYLKKDEASDIKVYDNTVYVFMSPNDISLLEDKFKDILRSQK